MNSVVELLQALIRIPSVNPDGDPGTDQIGEKACAEFVGEFLRDSGAEVELEEIKPGRPNVIGRFPSDSKGKPTVLFGPHTDTVSIKGMTIDPFGAEIRDGRIWGRGASDTKGSMAAMLWALREMRDEIPNLPANVMFVGFMSEESSQFGSRHFGKKYGDEVDFAIVGEPTEMDVVFKHKACWWLEISTTGRAAHGARPELGENAILKMTHLVQALDSDFRTSLDQFEDEILGKPTISINQCQGGSRANIVPDRCTITADIRATPSLYDKGVVDFVRGYLDANGFEDVEIGVTCSSPSLDTEAENPYVKQFQAIGSKLVGAPWFCDAGWLAQSGIPGIAIGPGSIAQAHTPDEWIKVTELEAGAAKFREFLQKLS